RTRPAQRPRGHTPGGPARIDAWPPVAAHPRNGRSRALSESRCSPIEVCLEDQHGGDRVHELLAFALAAREPGAPDHALRPGGCHALIHVVYRQAAALGEPLAECPDLACP